MLGRIPRPKGEVGSGQRGILQYFSFLYPPRFAAPLPSGKGFTEDFAADFDNALTNPRTVLRKSSEKFKELFPNGFVRHFSALVENRGRAGYHHPAAKPWVCAKRSQYWKPRVLT